MVEVGGSYDPHFAAVRDAFGAVVAHDPAGSALAVWHDGAFVVDLWGGSASSGPRSAWSRDTLAMPYSVSKPFAAAAVLLLVARGRLNLDDPVQRYWPQLHCPASVRQVLDHSAGLVVLERPAPQSALLDWDDLCARLAEQEPAWPPGQGVGESALFYGHLTGELVRRVDGRSLGQFLRDEVCAPRGLDLHVGVPDADLSRVADLVASPDFPGTGGGRLRSAALGNPPGATDPVMINSRAWRQAEVPAVNAHATARAVAAFHAALAADDLLPTELRTEMTTVQAEGPDAVTGSFARWGLGVAVEPDGWGMGGLGGSLGWWSDEGGYALGFVTGYLAEHDRSERLENVLRGCLGLGPL